MKRPITKSCSRSVLEKHPLEGFCQETILLPDTTFDKFFSVAFHLAHSRPTCGRRRIPVFLRVVSAMGAPHQTPIRIKALDVSLPSQPSAPGTLGAPENRQCPALSRTFRTPRMAIHLFSRGHFSHAQHTPTVVCCHRLRGETPNAFASGAWYGARATAH